MFAITVEHRAGITLREEEIVAGVRHKVFPEFIIFKYKVLQACWRQFVSSVFEMSDLTMQPEVVLRRSAALST